MSEQEKEPRFFHLNKGKIEYQEYGGQLWYSYVEEVYSRAESGASGTRRYRARGIIPKEIIDQGQVAIKNFSKSQIEKKIRAEKTRDIRLDEYLRSLSYPVELDYEDILLKGTLTSFDGTVLIAELLEPYHAIYSLTFGFASAVSGHYIFNDDKPPNFSDYAIRRGEGMLIKVYQEEKHKVENK